ncbi:MAG: cupin domain-containing protein [Anaerolineae bacterium]|nr:cupin domain-containing protein [Anaerolineae bacterium]NUQ03338.1 cupin domain-containing protein [Anaerolineae bacterium]
MSSSAASPYLLFPDLLDLTVEPPQESIISRTLTKDDQLNVTLFSFAAGQALTDHSAASTAIIHILDGEAVIGLGDEKFDLKAGAWIRMEPRLTHSVFATTSLKMLLILLPKTAALKES